MAEVPDAGASAMDVDANAYGVTDKITLVSPTYAMRRSQQDHSS